jgi:hypothetical protein
MQSNVCMMIVMQNLHWWQLKMPRRACRNAVPADARIPGKALFYYRADALIFRRFLREV